VKCVLRAHKGKKNTGLFEYLNDIQSLISLKSGVSKAEEFTVEKLEEALMVRAACEIQNTFLLVAGA